MGGSLACVKNSKTPNGAREWKAIEEGWGSERGRGQVSQGLPTQGGNARFSSERKEPL